LLAVRGKGYYINQVNVNKKLRICLIFNKLSNYKRSIYYSFVKTMGIKATVDVFIYNYDPEEFEAIVDNNLNNYDYFVILPHFRNMEMTTQQVTESHLLSNTHISEVIKKIPREKVLIVDRYMDELKDY